MKIVKLTQDMFFKGRWRREGEVMPVDDGFSDGEVLVENSDKKHKKPKKDK